MVEFEDELEEEFDEEFDDEFEDDWEEFEPEPEEFFTGPLYIPTQSSVNFELYSLFGSIVAMAVASFLLYTQVLVGVYDAGFGSASLDEQIANFDYQQAQGKVEIVGFGKYNNEDKEGNYDYAVLDAGSKQGLVPGMIYYFKPADGTGTRNGFWELGTKKEAGKLNANRDELTMLVIRKVDENSAWAIFTKYTKEGEVKNTLYNNRFSLANEPGFKEYTDLNNPITLDTPFPYDPKSRKPFQYYIWEEALDLSGEKIYKPVTFDMIDKDFNTIEDSSFEDYADPNVDWNMMKRITLSLDDIKKLLNITGNEAINTETSKMQDDSKGNFEKAIIIFNNSQYAFLAPPVDQSLFNTVMRAFED